MANFDRQNYVGRVDITGYKTGKPYSMTQDLGVNSNRGFENSLEHYLEETEVSKCFFSRKNINLLQNAVIFNVNKKLELDGIDYKIGKQDEKHLHVVMRGIYLQESNNLPCGLGKQIRRLNGKVIDFVIPNIITNVKQYVYYLKDISTPVSTMDRPIAVSSKSNNTELQPDVGFVSFSK